MMGVLQLFLILGGIVPAIYGNSQYSKGLEDQKKTDVTASLR